MGSRLRSKNKKFNPKVWERITDKDGNPSIALIPKSVSEYIRMLEANQIK